MANEDAKIPKKILFIEDSMLGLSGHIKMLEGQGIKVYQAADLSTALYHFNHERFEVVVISQEFAELPGLALAQKFRNNEIKEKTLVPIVVTSTKTKRLSGDESLAREVGDIEFLPKPYTPAILLSMVVRCKQRLDRIVKVHGVQENVVNFYRKSGNFEKAIEAVKKQLPALGDKGLEMMVDLHLEAEKKDDALQLLNSLLSRPEKKQDIKLLNRKASLLMEMGKLEEAKECFELADKVAPLNIERMNQMAELYLDMDMPEKSVEKYKDVLGVTPEEPELKFSIFEKLSAKGYDESAISFCKEITSSVEVVKHYNNSGVMKSKVGHAEEAINKYEYALKLIPEDKNRSKIYFNMAIAHINSKKKGSLEKASQCLEQCLEIDPNFEKANQFLDRIKSGNI